MNKYFLVSKFVTKQANRQVDKIKLNRNGGGKGGAAWFNIVHLKLVFYITGPW